MKKIQKTSSLDAKPKKEGKEQEQKEEPLPFPNARVVNLIRKHTGKKMLKKRVKVEMNRLLGKICADISDRMAKMPYAFLTYAEFLEAAKPYLRVELTKQKKKKIIATFRKIKEDALTMAIDLEEELEEE